MFGLQSHKNKAGVTYSSGTAMAELVFWLNNRFQFSAADRNRKAQDNCSLLYSSISQSQGRP